MANGKSWSDGLEAITTIRNSLVHPDAGSGVPLDSYYLAWNLSLWHIKFSIIHSVLRDVQGTEPPCQCEDIISRNTVLDVIARVPGLAERAVAVVQAFQQKGKKD